MFFEITLLQVFYVQIAKGKKSKNAKDNNSKKCINFFLNFHQVIYSLSSISRPSLKILAVIIFEISSFSMSKFAKGNN